MKIDFDLEFILKMINEEGKLLKDVQEYYGCTRGQLSWFLRKYDLNFRNHINARKKQSEKMSGSTNPTKGRKRTEGEMAGIKKAHKEKAMLYWDLKFKDGITYKQYSKICRNTTPTEMKKKVVKFETEIDHIFSVKDCWENKIHPNFVNHERNLRIISSEENRLKGQNSLYDLETFLSKVGVQRLSKAQFNWKQVE